MTAKLIIIGILISSLGGFLFWLDNVLDERAQFETERDMAVTANAAVVEDNNFLLNEIRTRDADILAREALITKMTAKTAQIREELADAKEELSDEELVCLIAPIPNAYRDKLLQRSRSKTAIDRGSVPLVSVLPTVPIR